MEIDRTVHLKIVTDLLQLPIFALYDKNYFSILCSTYNFKRLQ